MKKIGSQTAQLRHVFLQMAFFIVAVATSSHFVAAQAPLMSVFSDVLPIKYEECLSRARDTLTAEGYKAERAAGNAFWGAKGGHYATIICDGTPHPDGKIDFHVTLASNWNGAALEYKNLTDRIMGRRTDPVSGNGTFTGTWFHFAWGDIVLIQDGNRVNGSYTKGNNARITGIANGNKLTFSTEEGNGSRGEGIMVLQPDGKIQGNWCSGRGCNPAYNGPFVAEKKK